MRGSTCSANSSTLWVERTMRSTVWQLTQLVRLIFCWSEPGTLIIHSPLESSEARFLVAFCSLMSVLAGLSAATSAARAAAGS